MNDLGPILDEALGHARERVPGEDVGAVAFDTATVLAHILASGQEGAARYCVSDLNILSASVKVAQNVLSRNLHRQWLISPGSHPVAGCGTRMTLGDILRTLAERLPDTEPTTADYQRVAAVLADLTLFTKGWAPIELPA